MNKFSRRVFCCGGSALATAVLNRACFAQTTSKPLLFVHLFANGGWDVASFCDPKINGTKKINTWAESDGIKTQGAIAYAPVADNVAFFTRHQDKMLVINGINAKTNVHSAGRLTSLTGHGKNGYPSIAALHAATLGAQLPMPLLVGSSFETGGIVAATKINSGLIELLKPAKKNSSVFLDPAQMQLIETHLITRALKNPSHASTEFYQNAVLSEKIYFSNTMDWYETLNLGELPGTAAVLDMKFAMAAFAAGASVACDYSVSGFDTHDKHDKNFIAPLTTITQAADAAWQFAEQLKIDDRLVVVMSSDFGRTPFYNDVAGKDHWPFHSVLIMKKNATWTNRVIGQTDDNLIGIPLDPNTLSPNPNGILLEMDQVHQSLRNYLLVNSALRQAYPIENTWPSNFFVSN
jgi:hypothetical protein